MTNNSHYRAILDQVTIRFPDHQRTDDGLIVRVDGRRIFVSEDSAFNRIVVWAELEPVDVYYSGAAAIGAQMHVAGAYHERGFSIGMGADQKALAIGRSIDGVGADIGVVADALRALAQEIPTAQETIAGRIQALKEIEAQDARAEQENGVFVRV